MPQPLIQLEGLEKVFTTDEVETHVLSDVRLEVRRGESASIAGPSGCGKSALLPIRGFLDTPTAGTYVLDAQPASGLRLSERARIRSREIGFIFQSFNLIGDPTVLENVGLSLAYRGMPAGERRKRVTECSAEVGMSHCAGHLPNQLSGGRQQRIAVARALAGRPSILLAVEPTGSLDSTNGGAVMELLRDLHQSGARNCMVTHDERFTRFADRTAHLFAGRIVREAEAGNRQTA